MELEKRNKYLILGLIGGVLLTPFLLYFDDNKINKSDVIAVFFVVIFAAILFFTLKKK